MNFNKMLISDHVPTPQDDCGQSMIVQGPLVVKPNEPKTNQSTSTNMLKKLIDCTDVILSGQCTQSQKITKNHCHLKDV